MSDLPPGLIIAAPASGSGKTLITLGLLRALSRNGTAIGSAKVGPDYIDPAFHAAATGRPCFNLDLWAMRAATLDQNLTSISSDAELVVAEGVMGLFDGSADGRGSTADLSAMTDWPVILTVDSRSQGASAAALVRGFSDHRKDVPVAGVVFNKIGSEKHKTIIADAMRQTLPHIPVLGFVPRSPGLEVPSRHLGLVQAREKDELDNFIETAADLVENHIDLCALTKLAKSGNKGVSEGETLPPPGQRVAIADDVAFAFAYPHVLSGWREAGAEILPFSPLKGEAPSADADSIYLPGGYPELHADTIASNSAFLSGLKKAADAGLPVFGECGGYMVLGKGLVDARGERHQMAGLLPVETSFANRKLHLGYRRADVLANSPIGRKGTRLKGHEFHYASTVSEGSGPRLFDVQDAAGAPLGQTGFCIGSVAGSFLHVIDRAAP